MAAGLSLAEREALRERYRQHAIALADKLGMSLRCQSLAYDLDHPGHRLCAGEKPGNHGCLCRCHDKTADG